MWLYAKNMDKDNTNMDMLIQTSKMNKVLVARISCLKQTGYQDQITNNQQFGKAILIREGMIKTLIYVSELERQYQM
jgi:hypothetical protein